MGMREILHRAKTTFRDRFHPPKYVRWTPEEAYERLSLANSSAIVTPRIAAPASQPVVDEGDALLHGDWSIFGHQIQLDDPPIWNKNYVRGGEWPDVPADNLDYRRNDIADGVKFTWELGRWTWATSLATAYASTKEDRYRELCIRWLEDFARKNPISQGIHHTSGIEDAVRVLAGLIAIGLLDAANDDRLIPVLGLIYQQALHCSDHLSEGTSANNHLIAEYASMLAAGAALPNAQHSEKLRLRGSKGLYDEILTQVNPDGTSVEQSFGYIPFIWELVIIPLIIASANGLSKPPQTVHDRLKMSLEFMRSVRLPDGTAPQIGDEDDGRILLPGHSATRLDLVGNLLAKFLGAPLLSDEPDASLLAEMFSPGNSLPAHAPPHGVHKFPDGGYTVWRDKLLLVTLDHGPLGWQSIAAHGHADALSVTVFAGSVPIVVDPGVYAYQDDPAARDRFRGTPYHSTVNFDNRNQSEILGPFMWGRRARTYAQGDGWECAWHTGERHWRAVSVESNVIRIEDRVDGLNPETVFVLHPAAIVEVTANVAKVSVRGVSATFESDGLGAWRCEPGEYSRMLSHKEPTIRLCATFEKPYAKVTITVDAG